MPIRALQVLPRRKEIVSNKWAETRVTPLIQIRHRQISLYKTELEIENRPLEQPIPKTRKFTISSKTRCNNSQEWEIVFQVEELQTSLLISDNNHPLCQEMVIHRLITNSESPLRKILVMSSTKEAASRHPNSMPNKQHLTPEWILSTQAKMNPQSSSIMDNLWLRTIFRVQHRLEITMEAVLFSILAKDKSHIITTSSIAQITSFSTNNSNITEDLLPIIKISIRLHLLKHLRPI